MRSGVILGVLTAIFYSLYLLTLKKTLDASVVSGVCAMLLISLFCVAILGLYALLRGLSLQVTEVRALVALAGVGVLGTTIGWSLITSAIRHVSTTVTGFMLLLQPALSFLWDVAFFGRVTAPLEYVGVALVLAAIYLGALKREVDR